MKYLSKVLLVSIIMILPFKVFAFEFNFGKKYLDYGNGAINLELVTHISPSWDYIYTTPEDSESDIFKNYSETPSKNTIKERVKSLFDVKVFKTLEWYYLKNTALISFDNFKLTTLAEEVFFKIPDCDVVNAAIMAGNPNVTTFYINSAEAFGITNDEDTCIKLQKKQNKLTENAIEKIQDGLFDTIKIYSKVVDR